MKRLFYFVIIFLSFFSYCKKETAPPAGKGNKLEITTGAISGIASDSALSGGDIIGDGGERVTNRGVCWGINSAPTINNDTTKNGTGSGSYVSKIRGLQPNTLYYIRAYATHYYGTIYGNELQFRTAAGAPVVSTNCSPTSISYTAATVQGTISSTGGAPITQAGICYSSTNTLPTISNSFVSFTNLSQGIQAVSLVNLIPGTRYYFRTFAKNNVNGTYGYGNVCSFSTAAIQPPSVVSVCSTTGLSYTTVNLQGTITADGGASLSSVGICYSATTSLPTVANTTVLASSLAVGSFSVALSGLTPGTTYYYRTYAKNSVNANYSYGAVCSFSTLAVQPPSVSSVCSPTSLTYTAATLQGIVNSDGGANLSAMGICYSSTTTAPTISNNIIGASPLSLGFFSVNITGLTSGVTYYFRTYAKNGVNANYSYGTVCSFTTPAIQPPTVTSSCNPLSVSYNTASLQGTISNTGGAALTAIGICYSSSTTNPTIASSTVSGNPLAVGTFSVNLSGLNSGVTYYYRTYAKNSINVNYAYGAVCSFTTLTTPAPTVTTTCPSTSTITSTSALVSGAVSQAGSATITERGFCYSSSTTNPTIANSTIINGSGTGTFNSTLSGLAGCTTYYVRAFARNSIGVYAYGAVCSFTTLAGAPAQIQPANASSQTSSSACIYFQWSSIGCATSYQIQISRSSTFSYASTTAAGACGSGFYISSSANNQFTTTLPNFQINSGTSSQNGVWYWRVRAINGANVGSWSSTRSYTYTW